MRLWIATAALAATYGISSTPALATCELWDLSGRSLSLEQGNGLIVTFDLNQDGAQLRGKARYFAETPENTLVASYWGEDFQGAGEVEGRIAGGTADLRVEWNGGSIGIYQIQISDSGHVDGETSEFQRPENRARLLGHTNLNCLQRDAASAAASSPPVRATGSNEQSVAPSSIAHVGDEHTISDLEMPQSEPADGAEDRAIPPPPEPVPAPVAPGVGFAGTYLASLSITDSNCPFPASQNPVGKTVTKEIELSEPSAGVLQVPLNSVWEMFAEPISLQFNNDVDVSYQGPVRTNLQMGPSMNATLDGALKGTIREGRLDAQIELKYVACSLVGSLSAVRH
jgi:hypothetical protein